MRVTPSHGAAQSDQTRPQSGVEGRSNDGGRTMRTTFLFLASFTAICGFAFLSWPAAAECWMTCPPGSTAPPSATEQQPSTAETEQLASPEAQKLVTKVEVKNESSRATVPSKKKSAQPPAVANTPPSIEPKTTAAPVEEVPGSTPVQAKAAPVKQATPIEPTALPAVPAQNLVRPQTPPPAAAFQPAPVRGAAPSPSPLPGPIPGTATMRVIPE